MKLTDLTAQLEQEASETLKEAKELEQAALRAHETALKQQLDSVVLTFKNDSDNATAELLEYGKSQKETLRTICKELKEQSGMLRSEIERTVPRLIWAVRLGVFLPIPVVLAACGLIVAITNLWMPKELWHLHTHYETVTDGKQYLVIEDSNWRLCNLTPSAGKGHETLRPCKTLDLATPPQQPAKP